MNNSKQTTDTIVANNNCLTAQQVEAVTTDAREVLVVAGAGSGKTRVLSNRILHLLKGGASPYDLCVITFTRKAAAQMSQRIGELLTTIESHNPQGILSQMTIGTFHSIALSILHAHGDHIGYDAKSITVVSPEDAQLLLDRVCEEFGYKSGSKWKNGMSGKKVTDYLETFYNCGPQSATTTQQTICRRIAEEYRARLHDMNALDFGSLLLECQRLFNTHAEILDRYHDQIKHVLVDELQDANTIQHYGFLDLLCPPATFFGVGDVRQTIYGFRGARPELMHERHVDAEVLELTECFRCAPEILWIANNLMDNDAPLMAATDRHGRVHTSTVDYYGLTACVIDLVSKGYGYADIAILARTHSTLKSIEEALIEREIPCHRVGSSFSVCSTSEFLQLHAAMRLEVNSRDDLALLRCLDLYGISDEQYAIARTHAANQGLSHYEACLNLVGEGDIMRDGYGDRSVSEFMDAFECTSEIWAGVRTFWLGNCADMTVEQALRWYALRDSQDDVLSGDNVTLMTIHAAKGLEWPAGIVADLNESKFPGKRAARENTIDEERRLCYVAITRAKEQLILHSRLVDSHGNRLRPSRFLAEAGIETT